MSILCQRRSTTILLTLIFSTYRIDSSVLPDPQDLLAMKHSENTNSILMLQIAQLTHHAAIQSISIFFVSICSVMGLLGVALSLFDFLADRLQYKKTSLKNFFLLILPFYH